jgi:hypothetical protein
VVSQSLGISRPIGWSQMWTGRAQEVEDLKDSETHGVKCEPKGAENVRLRKWGTRERVGPMGEVLVIWDSWGRKSQEGALSYSSESSLALAVCRYY